MSGVTPDYKNYFVTFEMTIMFLLCPAPAQRGALHIAALSLASDDAV